MTYAHEPRPRSFAIEQRRRAPVRHSAPRREPAIERAATGDGFDQSRDLPCIRLAQRARCLLQQRPSE